MNRPMSRLASFGVAAVVALALPVAGTRAADCPPIGGVEFVCGQAGPEDLAVVPGEKWVVAGGDTGNDGAMRLIRVSDRTTTILFPGATSRERPDVKTYDSCPGPLDAAEKASLKFRSHGLSIAAGRNSVHTLYMVHHGSRESIEVFELDARADPPTATWVGCVMAPDPVGLNAVVGLPGGGFVATNFSGREEVAARPKVNAGEITGELWEWHTRTGWKQLPGTETSGPNGVELSKDGKWLFVAAFGSRSLLRVSRGQSKVTTDSVPLGFRVDNIRWAPDGSLFATGPGGTGSNQSSNVVKIDPNTLKIQELIRYPYNDAFRFGTVAIQVGNEIWVGSNRGERIARFPTATLPRLQ
jgi:sugar lactone lactonase YvrE